MLYDLLQELKVSVAQREEFRILQRYDVSLFCSQIIPMIESLESYRWHSCPNWIAFRLIFAMFHRLSCLLTLSI